MGSLDGKVTLVTGGASGLGLAIAERLLKEGAIVFVSDVQSDLGNTIASTKGFNYFHHDVCDEARWNQIVGEIERRSGHLDILVNNAGILGPADAVTPENSRLIDWKRIFSVNVEGVFLGCRTAIASMRRSGGGSIINISSVAGLLATPHATAYGASKAAVWHLTKSVAQHCAQERLNIRCNSVHPGDVRTTLWDQNAHAQAENRGVSFDRVLEEAVAVTPLGSFCHPSDIAAAVCFLSSAEARYITGTQLVVDSGIVGCDTYHMTQLALTRK